jgi:competence protein ComEC
VAEAEEQPATMQQELTTEDPIKELFKEVPSLSQEALTDKEKLESKESIFEIHFLDVGQADSILVLCDDQAMLVDGGDPDDSRFIYTYLKENGIEHLDVIVCTHAHSDHAGGLAGALNYSTVGMAYAPVSESDNSAFIDFVGYLKRQNVEITIPSHGDEFALGSSTVTVLGPVNPSDEPNNTSIVLRIEYGETSFLLMGDAETEEEQDILNKEYILESTVLKVGHHGSSSSSDPRFIAAVDPEYAVITDGIDASGYGGLTERTLEKLQAAGAEIYRTDLQGNIICKSNGKTVSFSVEKEVETTEVFPLVLITPAAANIEAPVVRSIETPEPEFNIPTYILNTNSHKFHYPSCSSVDAMKESNKKEFFGTREEARNMGYDPCGRCHP